MATERFSGKVPDFLVAAQAGGDLGNEWSMQRELREADVGPQAPAQPGLDDVQGTASAPQPFNNDAAMARRAEIMRKYGKDADANQLLQANSQLGLTNAQAGEVRQRTSNDLIAGKTSQLGLDTLQRENDAKLAVKKIRDGTTGELGGLTDEDGNRRDATPDELFANQQKLSNKLYSAGFTDHAEAAVKQMKEMTAARITADTTARKEAANAVMRQVQRGDYSGLADYIKRFAYGSPDTSITGVSPGANGAVNVTAGGPGGSTTKSVPGAVFQAKVLGQLNADASDNAAVASQAYANIDAQMEEHKAATIAHKASAGASSAAADSSKERTLGEKYGNDRKKLLDQAYDTAEADRTPAQKALIQGYSDHVDDSRPARQPNTGKPQVKVNFDGSQTATMPDGSIYQQGRAVGGKPAPWVDTTPGRPPQPAPASLTGAALGVAPGAAPASPFRPAANGTFDYVPPRR